MRFQIQVIPENQLGFDEIEKLRDAIRENNAQHGEDTCGTFCQLHVTKIGHAVDGRLFTGNAAKYLRDHLNLATIMQDKLDAEKETERGN